MAGPVETPHDDITAVEDPEAPRNQGKEKAARFLASVDEGERTFTPEEEKRVLKRIDRRLLPLLLGAYFFQQLDKSTLSYVSIFGLVEDANLHGQQYSWLGSILYLAQLVMQPIAALLLVKLPTGKLIGSAIFLWGSSLAIMAACTDFPSLLGLRFTLGAFEAMIAPSCVAVTQMWWRRGEQTLRTAYWNGMNGVTFVVGSLFTYGLGHIHSDTLYSYQIIFMFCGLLTVAFSLIVLIFMPDSPMEAKCLNHREKIIAVERLRANQMGVVSREWRWDHVWETLCDMKTWCWFFLIVAISIPSGGISTFGNLIIKSFGYGSFETILFNIPFGVIQVIAIVGGGWLATRFQRKGLVIVGFAIISAIGTLLMIVVPREQKGVLLFGYYLVSFLAGITPLVYAWEAQNTAGDTKRKCTSAVVLIGMCAGNVIGPQLYSTSQAPLYRPGLISNLILFVIVGVFAILTNLYLIYLNRKHAQRRLDLGKSAQVVDESMLSKQKVGKAVELEDVNALPQQNQTEDKGFSDTTDLKNEDFIYVY
ncbi:major facilitator superfamily domain-containing protein [Aspergillus caelatus]|uniref:Major facilitator superfamily domain-containing protein n=1 Tax=Aspergillus caelatus TaxID=61420 RepID=A0A5N7A3T1_9EURO|nr:major facilitator superfamily domain-containing protein [Aspergillus caelatus]KAE8364517.1 major facilitator superfamily domain-containing protein [Aspergillus caelatus]